MNPRRKKILFYAIVVCLPFLFLFSLEVGLRLLGLFEQQPFIIESSKNDIPVYQLNQHVAQRYFDPRKFSVPGVSPETFTKYRFGKTFRIFCLGGSTMAGFPFDCQVPFPVQLRYLLTQSYPDYEFEVINAGISAVNSFTVIDLLPEILELQPDLLLIYMGHNEFYGAYGSASTISPGAGARYIRFYLKLQKLHVVQMLKRMVSGFGSAGNEKAGGRTLMANVVQDQQIPYRSDKYNRTLANFRENLGIILEMCRREAVPVVVSNLVSNIRDLEPFADGRSEEVEPGEHEKYRKAVAMGDSLLQSELYEPGLAAYQEALAIDSSSATLWFKLGRTLAAIGDSANAGYYFYGAKERDPIRFRASEDFNRAIKDVVGSAGATIVDMRERFSNEAPQRLIGKTLMCDHLHPNPFGYYLMARAFYDKIVDMGILKNRDLAFEPAERPYFVSDLDWDIGLLKIFEMVHRWPFEEKPVTFDDYQPYGDPVATEIAREYLFGDNVWSRAKYKMAQKFLARRELEKARNEYLAVSLFAPQDPYPYLQVAKTYEIEQAWDLRESYLRRALPLSQAKGMLNYQISLCQWRQGELRKACDTMTLALTHNDLSRKQKQNARFYLAGFYADLHNSSRAAGILQELLREDPNFQPARVFLQRLQMLQN